jgi:hypothetical protein
VIETNQTREQLKDTGMGRPHVLCIALRKKQFGETAGCNKPIGRGAQKNEDRSALGKLRSLAPVTAATVSADETATARSALVEDGTETRDFTGAVPISITGSWF